MSARILVVDDEVIIAMDVTRRLQQLGYDVPEAANTVDEALDSLRQSKPDLILLDINLNDRIDGVQLAAQIHEKNPIPIIFLTAYSDDETISRATMALPYGYIVKPFNDRELKAAIEIALYKHGTEKKLQKIENWLATTLKSLGDAVISADMNGIINYMNPVAENLTGWRQRDAIGKPLREILVVLRESDRSSVECPGDQALKEGCTTVLEENVFLVCKNGKEVPIDDTAAPIRNDQGAMTGVVVIFRDISLRKNAQDEKIKVEEALRQAQKLETLGKLAGGVAHDFNNLLTVILGQTEVLLAKPTLSEEQALKRLRAIGTAGSKAASLTRQLLAFGRKQVMYPKSINLNLILTEIEPLLISVIGEDVEILLKLQARIPLINVDPVQIEQVILNLSTNARDAMPRGGKLTIETKVVDIDDAYTRLHQNMVSGLHVALVVSDSGIGMDVATKARVFEPFFTTKEVGKGTGLGLGTVYGIVKQSGGHIEVYSELDMGSTFKVYFPINANLEPESIELLPSSPADFGQRMEGVGTVLVVEDEEGVRELICETLLTLGFNVFAAANTEEAEQVFDKNLKIDLVISDIVMPRESGPAFVKRMRNRIPNIKVLFISGYSQVAIEREGVLDSNSSFMEKPFRTNDLIHVVQKIMKQV